MKTLNLIVEVCLICLFATASACAREHIGSGAIPVSEIIKHSDIIADAELIDYKSAQPQESNVENPGSNHSITIPGVLKEPGKYTFHVRHLLKGQCDQTLHLTLSTLYAADYDYASVNFKTDARVLLFLKHNAVGDSSSVNILMPPMLIAPNAQISASDSAPESQVVNLLINSLADENYRQVDTYFLRTIVSKEIVSRILPFLTDANTHTYANVLYCLATNQQVSAIPLIARLERQKSKLGGGGDVVVALKNITTPEAVPYLNPLLVDTDYWLRLNAALALGRLADQTSIPYLILALRDPDPQHVIPSDARGVLHRLIPSLPLMSHNSDYFYAHRAEEAQPIYQWWSDELSGKHLAKDQSEESPKPMAMPETVNGLNPILFSPFLSARLAAIKKLDALANTSSYPYLVLALQDPNTDVAYGAYKILHRLIATLGPTVDINAFALDSQSASRPIYDWWSGYLGGKAPVFPSAKGFIPLPGGK